jgi:hypothetical protein
MKLDPGMHIGLHLVSFGKSGVTQGNVCVAAAQIEERGPGYSRSAASSYYRSRSERPRQQRRSQGPLDPVAEEGRGENKVMQPGNPAANTVANAPANPAANAPPNAPANTAGYAANNAANAVNIQGNPPPNPRRNAGAQPPLVQADHAEGSRRHRIRDEVEIARRANYDRENGVPALLDANNPIQATDLRIMHDQELLRRAQYNQDNGPPDDLYISLLIMLHQQVWGRSTIFQLSHDVSGRSDTLKTSSLLLRSTTVAPTRVYGSRCTV